MRQRIRTGIILGTFLLLSAIFHYSPYPIIMGASEGIIFGSFIVFAAGSVPWRVYRKPVSRQETGKTIINITG